MATPTLRYVAPSGSDTQSHLEPEPVIIHDLPTGGDTSALEARVSALESAISTINQTLTDLEGRVAALETP